MVQMRVRLGMGLDLGFGLELIPYSTVYCSGIRNIRSQDYSFPGTFVPMKELSF